MGKGRHGKSKWQYGDENDKTEKGDKRGISKEEDIFK